MQSCTMQSCPFTCNPVHPVCNPGLQIPMPSDTGPIITNRPTFCHDILRKTLTTGPDCFVHQSAVVLGLVVISYRWPCSIISLPFDIRIQIKGIFYYLIPSPGRSKCMFCFACRSLSTALSLTNPINSTTPSSSSSFLPLCYNLPLLPSSSRRYK
jgi:hypothetical protein